MEVDGAQPDMMHMAPDTEYIFEARYAPVLDTTRTKGVPAKERVTECPGYKFLVATQAGAAVRILDAD